MKKISIALVCAFMLIAVSCRMKKPVEKNVELQHQKEQIAYDMLSQTQHPSGQTITSALFELGQGGRTVKSKAEISMIADSCIQISVRPLLGIEVFRVGIMTDGVILLDRLNGQYCQMRDRELNQYGGMNTRQFYNLVQSSISAVTIGWDFAPIRKGEMDHYAITFEGNLLTLLPQKGVASGYKQILRGSRLIESSYSSEQIGIELNTTVEYPSEEGAVSTPSKTIIKGRNLNGKEQVKLELFNYKTDRKPSFNLQIPKSYRSITLKELIESIK